MVKKIFSIFTFCALVFMSVSGIIFATGEPVEQENPILVLLGTLSCETVDANGVTVYGGCNYFCSWCIPMNNVGACTSSGAFC